MTVHNLSKRTGLPEQTIKDIYKSGILKKEINHDSQAEVERVNLITNLILVRFSLEQIQKMNSSPELIKGIIESHIRDLKDLDFPLISETLRMIDLTKVKDVNELGQKVSEALNLPPETGQLITELKGQCLEIINAISDAAKTYRFANLFDGLAFIPVIGFPFGLIRTAFLSKGADKMRKAEEINNNFNLNLSKLEFNIDLMSIISPNLYKGRFYDYASAPAATENYLVDIMTKMKSLKDRALCINELLNKLSL